MLLLDDDDELSADEERLFTAQLGPDRMRDIDDTLISLTRSRWLKVARIIFDALKAGGFPSDDAAVAHHARRVIALVAVGALEAQGNLRKPRWSEVRVPRSPLH